LPSLVYRRPTYKCDTLTELLRKGQTAQKAQLTNLKDQNRDPAGVPKREDKRKIRLGKRKLAGILLTRVSHTIWITMSESFVSTVFPIGGTKTFEEN
jgi:hypothetical protein